MPPPCAAGSRFDAADAAADTQPDTAISPQERHDTFRYYCRLRFPSSASCHVYSAISSPRDFAVITPLYDDDAAAMLAAFATPRQRRCRHYALLRWL